MARKPLILDRYEPLGTAGSGGFGTVRIAWDPRIQRKVAIKTIQLSETDALRARLPGADAVNGVEVDAGEGYPGSYGEGGAGAHGEGNAEDPGEGGSDAAGRVAPVPVTALAHLPGLDEARTAAMLSDSRIVTVFDFEIRGRVAYLIMEYVEGLTLTRILADYGDDLTLDMVAAVFHAVAGALGVAHKAGVLHLDIKPDNIIVNADGQAKVTDFGLATLADASGAGTTGGGTIGYMPLEQMRRQPLDARTDEWSLAALTYEMMTGENPFRAPDLASAEPAIEDAELVVPSLCWDDIDDQIDDVIFYALDPDPDRRYASVADFAEEVEKFLGDPEEGKAELAAIVKAELNPRRDSDGAGGKGAPEAQRGNGGDPRRSGLLARLAGLAGLGRNVSPDALSAHPPDIAEEDIANWEPDRYGSPPRDAHARVRLPRLIGARRTHLQDKSDLPSNAAGSPSELSDAALGPRGREKAEAGESGGGAQGAPTAPFTPLAARVPERVKTLGGRIYAAAASALLATFALVNVPLLEDAFGAGAAYVIGAAVVVVALAALASPGVGALVSLELLALALVACGHWAVALVLAAAALAWWYLIAFRGFGSGSREPGMACANVALLAAPAGAIGGASVVPFAAGASLRLVPALATTALAALEALVLAALGSDTLLGWNAFTNWAFTSTDVTGNFVELLQRPATWATVGGWLSASAVLSLAYRANGRWLHVAGLAVALACVLAGSLAFAVPTPDLFIGTILATAALLLVT